MSEIVAIMKEIADTERRIDAKIEADLGKIVEAINTNAGRVASIEAQIAPLLAEHAKLQQAEQDKKDGELHRIADTLDKKCIEINRLKWAIGDVLGEDALAAVEQRLTAETGG